MRMKEYNYPNFMNVVNKATTNRVAVHSYLKAKATTDLGIPARTTVHP